MTPKDLRSICDIDCDNYQVIVDNFKHACKYHNKRKAVFLKGHLSSGGMCPHLFHKAYPYALALLYGANFRESKEENNLNIPCPALNSPITIKIYRVKQRGLIDRISNALKEVLIILGFHCNPLYYRVHMKVISADIGCNYNHSENDTFEFNIGNASELCPAAFDAIFPQLLRQGHRPMVVCPDHLGKVSFRIGRCDEQQ